MMKSFRNKVNNLLFELASKSRSMDEFRYTVTMRIMVMVSVIPHIVFFVGSLGSEYVQFIYLNAASIAIYAFIFFLIQKKMFRASVAVICFEIAFFSLFSVAYFGFDSDFQWYILLAMVPQFLFVDTTKLQRLLTTLFLYLSLLAAIYIDRIGEPLYNSTLSFTNRVLNVNLVFWGIAFQLGLIQVVKWVTDSIEKRNVERIRMESWIDPLTGLYNRRYAEQFFLEITKEKRSAHSTQHVFAMIDIDNFKQINDQHGHVVGDKALQGLADLLTGNLRSTDMISRWGGEEFLIVLTGLPLQQAETLMDKLRLKVEEQEIVTDGFALGYTITIGVSVLEKRDVKSAIARCDEHLYYGKNNGKNQVVSRIL